METCPQIHFNLGVSYYEEKYLYRRIALRRRGQKSYYDKHNLSRHVSKRNSKIKRFFRSFWQWILLVFVAVIVGYAVVTFGFQTVTVVGPSMSPTLSDSQVVMVNKLAYKVSDVKRYDVIAYSRVDGDGYYDIKRVIGLPGETVEVKDGKVYIDGAEKPLDDSFCNEVPIGDFGPYEVPQNCYFMMGDNRNNSLDSRYWKKHFVEKDAILAKAVFRYWPFSEIGKVE